MPKTLISNIISPERLASSMAFMFVTGALLGLAAPGYGLWWYAWIGLVPALWWVGQQTSTRHPGEGRDPAVPTHWRRAALGGFLFGWAYHLVYLAWLPALHPLTWIGFEAWQSALIVGALYMVVTGLGGVLIGALLSFYALLFAACRQNRWIATVLIFGFPVVWTLAYSLFDVVQLWIPWAMLAYTQTHASSFFHAFYAGGEIEIVFFNMLIAWSLFMPPQPRRAVIIISLFFLMSIVALIEREEKNRAREPETFPKVAILQGNLPIDVVRNDRAAWDAAQKVYLDNIRSLNLLPDTLLVLPEEGPIPGWINTEAPAENPHFKQLMHIAREKKIHIITGASSYRYLPTDGREFFNGMALISPNTSDVIPERSDKRSSYELHARNPLRDEQNIQFYFKRDLVPFGERIPFVHKDWLAEQLRAFNVNFNPPFISGERNPAVMQFQTAEGKPVTLGGLICFELIKPHLSRGYPSPAMLVNTSNLGWFHGNAFGERLMQEQFLAIGQMRASESRAYVIISANTGISAIIDPSGRVLARSDRDGKPRASGATLLTLE